MYSFNWNCGRGYVMIVDVRRNENRKDISQSEEIEMDKKVNQKILNDKRIAVIGIGGVGGYMAGMLGKGL